MKHTFTKTITAMLVIFIFNFISSCVPESCPPSVLFYLKEVRIQSVDKVPSSDNSFDLVYTDTIHNQIAFEVHPTVEIAAAETQKTDFGMNKAYGDCEVGFVLNPIDISASKMYTNNTIYWDGEEIPPRTNLLKHPNIKELITFPTFLNYEGYTLITIETGAMKFLDEPYQFIFEWTTSDDILLTDEATIYLDL